MSKLTDAIPNRIRALRQERGWTLAELATRANTSAPQIMRIERSERQLTLDWIDRLAAAFDVPPIELVANRHPFGVVELPVIGNIQAGNWREAVQISDDITVVPTALVLSPNSFGLKVQGNSMDQIIPEGGIVIINPDDADLIDGKVFAIMNSEGETTVKRYRSSPARFEPVSSDPSHAVLNIGREPFTVVGRVTSYTASL